MLHLNGNRSSTYLQCIKGCLANLAGQKTFLFCFISCGFKTKKVNISFGPFWIRPSLLILAGKPFLSLWAHVSKYFWPTWLSKYPIVQRIVTTEDLERARVVPLSWLLRGRKPPVTLWFDLTGLPVVVVVVTCSAVGFVCFYYHRLSVAARFSGWLRQVWTWTKVLNSLMQLKWGF